MQGDRLALPDAIPDERRGYARRAPVEFLPGEPTFPLGDGHLVTGDWIRRVHGWDAAHRERLLV